MMAVEYATNAKRIVDDYLDAVGDRLRASESVDGDEVLDDLRGHVEEELAQLSQPVSEADVKGVLDRLGPPEQVVGDEDMSWWRKAILRLRTGPEDWRLAYLSLAVLILGTLIARPLGIIAGFCLSRAAVSLAGEPDPPAKKWLIYPALIVVYLLIGSVALLWPAYALGGLVGELSHGHGSLLYKEPLFDHDGLGTVLAVLGGGALGLSAWWSLLWAGGRNRPSLVRVLLKPFAEQWTGRTFGKVVLVAWTVTIPLATAAVLCWVLT